MDLENLDLCYFFKEEHGNLYGGEGIGAIGLITPNQMINVVNIDGEDKKSGDKDCWSLGAHQHTREEVIRCIYGIYYSEEDVYDKSDVRRGLTARMVEIRYVNNKFDKIISITIPSFINSFQYESLCFLNEQIQMLKNSCEINLKVNVSNNGLNPNECLVDSEIIFWDKKEDNLTNALEYYKDHIRDIDLAAFPENEAILNFESKRHSV